MLTGDTSSITISTHLRKSRQHQRNESWAAPKIRAVQRDLLPPLSPLNALPFRVSSSLRDTNEMANNRDLFLST